MRVENLTARTVATAKARPGKGSTMLGDGRGLYLRVTAAGSKHWVFRYKRSGVSHDMGLGPYPEVSLADAREKVIEQRKLLIAGNDPLATLAAKRVGARETTFADAAAKLIKAKADTWKARTRQQWESALRDHAKPLAGLNVRAIDAPLIFALLEPLWKTQRPTGMRVRTYIETVLDWATAHGYRTGPNPAAWDGNLEHMGLADASTLERKSREYVPPAEIAAVMAGVRALQGGAARALEMVMLSACRANEVLGATWDEFDLTKRVWAIPADRMKMKVSHRVPLNDAMFAVLKECARLDGCTSEADCTGLVFRSPQGMRMPDARLRETLHKLGRTETVHGFRSSFSQWAKEQGVRYEAYETQLAHAVGGNMERLYGSTDLLDMRRPVMEAWSNYLNGVAATDNVVELRSA